MVERKEEKSRSPLRQKASVVSKSTLICDLADPRLEEACGKEKENESGYVVHICHLRSGVVFYANLVV